MAHSRLMRAHAAMMILQLHCVACADDTAIQESDAASLPQARAMAAVPTMPPRPDTLPRCNDPVTDKPGYESVCPIGYFRCCATCAGAKCFSEKGLHMSWRGIRECIRCQPGDYCKGCDTYQKCRPSDIPGRIGAKISPLGATRAQDCEICPAGFEADLDRKRCVKRWTDVCNPQFVGRCVRNCRAEDPKNGKDMTFCERMKCQLYCANLWNSGCVSAFTHECLHRKAGPGEYDLFSEGEEWLTECDVDCNGVGSPHPINLLALLSVVMVMFGALHA